MCCSLLAASIYGLSRECRKILTCEEILLHQAGCSPGNYPCGSDSQSVISVYQISEIAITSTELAILFSEIFPNPPYLYTINAVWISPSLSQGSRKRNSLSIRKVTKFRSTSFKYFGVRSYLICPPPYISSCYHFWIPGIRPVFDIISVSCSLSDAGRLEQITSGRDRMSLSQSSQLILP